ncbi:MAG: glycosyltransferase [Alphaproteobacteria bacterium]
MPDPAVPPSTRSEAAAARRGPSVLQVLPALGTGGVERGTVDMAAAIVAAGGRAIVASAGGPLVRELERAGATHVALPLDRKNPFAIRANGKRLAALIDRHDVEIIHARSRAPAWSARAAAEATGARFLTTFHGTHSHGSWAKRRYNAIMARGERVIAVSRFIAEHAWSVYGVPAERLRIIPRGIDLRRFDPTTVSPERMIALAREWRLPDGVPVVMLPGRISRWKGHDVLIDAARRLGGREFLCVFVGPVEPGDTYVAELERKVMSAGLGGRVQMVGDCRDMPAAYMLADVVVAPSTQPEAFGRVPVEGQAMGRPVIATDHGGARETVVQGETGLLVPPSDAAALADAIADALDLDAADRMALGERAIAHVRPRFDLRVMCARTLSVYDELLGAAADPVRAPAAEASIAA